MINIESRYKLRVILSEAPDNVLIGLRSIKWQPAGGAKIMNVPEDLQVVFFDDLIEEMVRRGLPLPPMPSQGRPIPTGPLPRARKR